MSVCLFWHLVKFIDEYRFQEGVTVNKEMMRVPKLVYWSIGLDSEDYLDEVKKLILNQCPEILKKYCITDQTQYNWIHFSIKKFYGKYYPGCVVIIGIDQFNFAAQLGRIY